MDAHSASMFALTLVHLLSHISAHDFLSPGSSLSVDRSSDLLYSPDGTFTCGFYNISPNASIFSVWFSYSAEKTVVWSANLHRPVYTWGSKIKLNIDGSMVLQDYTGQIVWKNNVSSSNVQEARLLENGNLIVKGQEWEKTEDEDDEVEKVLRRAVRMLADNVKLQKGSEQSWIADFIDSRLNGQFNYLQARTMVKLAVSCIDGEGSKRPTMENVAQVLLSVDEESIIT
ncbi:hypothetical protein E2562_036072 [Oryza meyeriana var. granulata]|uniref:non-specific serine/threonine protein kinase n=1 Tax=Oryza meyeriana var. granulata TaxID=110450 RepID=A0A6G1CX43_9ORYZ|nr:hypothetical protein E2562_036072 [Oryza meyeriana var. granulata]